MLAAKQLLISLTIVWIAVFSHVNSAPTFTWEAEDVDPAPSLPRFESNRTRTEATTSAFSVISSPDDHNDINDAAVIENETSATFGLTEASRQLTWATDLIFTQSSSPKENDDSNEPLHQEPTTAADVQVDVEPLKANRSIEQLEDADVLGFGTTTMTDEENRQATEEISFVEFHDKSNVTGSSNSPEMTTRDSMTRGLLNAMLRSYEQEARAILQNVTTADFTTGQPEVGLVEAAAAANEPASTPKKETDQDNRALNSVETTATIEPEVNAITQSAAVFSKSLEETQRPPEVPFNCIHSQSLPSPASRVGNPQDPSEDVRTTEAAPEVSPEVDFPSPEVVLERETTAKVTITEAPLAVDDLEDVEIFLTPESTGSKIEQYVADVTEPESQESEVKKSTSTLPEGVESSRHEDEPIVQVISTNNSSAEDSTSVASLDSEKQSVISRVSFGTASLDALEAAEHRPTSIGPPAEEELDEMTSFDDVESTSEHWTSTSAPSFETEYSIHSVTDLSDEKTPSSGPSNDEETSSAPSNGETSSESFKSETSSGLSKSETSSGLSNGEETSSGYSNGIQTSPEPSNFKTSAALSNGEETSSGISKSETLSGHSNSEQTLSGLSSREETSPGPSKSQTSSELSNGAETASEPSNFKTSSGLFDLEETSQEHSKSETWAEQPIDSALSEKNASFKVNHDGDVIVTEGVPLRTEFYIVSRPMEFVSPDPSSSATTETILRGGVELETTRQSDIHVTNAAAADAEDSHLMTTPKLDSPSSSSDANALSTATDIVVQHLIATQDELTTTTAASMMVDMTSSSSQNPWITSDVDVTGRHGVPCTTAAPTSELAEDEVTTEQSQPSEELTGTNEVVDVLETTTSGEQFFQDTPLEGLINRTSITSLDLATVATILAHNMTTQAPTHLSFVVQPVRSQPSKPVEVADKCSYHGREYMVGEHVEQSNPCHFCVCVSGGYLDCYWKNCPPAPEGCVGLDFDGVCDRSLYVCPIPKKGEPLPFPVNSIPASRRRRSGSVEKLTCDILGVEYKVGELVGVASDPCMECRCALDSLYCSPKCCFQPSGPEHDPTKNSRSSDVLWQPVMANPLKHLRYEFERHNAGLLKK